MRALFVGRERRHFSPVFIRCPFPTQVEQPMTDRYAEYRYRSDVVVIPRIWVTYALSIMIHVAALWFLLPRLPLLAPGNDLPRDDRLQVQLEVPRPPEPAQPVPPTPPSRETRAILTARARPPGAPPREAPPEFVVPRPDAPAVATPPPAPPPVVETPKSYPPVEGDLASMIEARRRARGEPTAPLAETDNERRDRIVAANMPSSQSPLASQQKKRGGGLFEITRMAYDDGEFRFFGWHRDAGRKLPQVIEVRLGTNSDMRIAMVRRMIALIRETEQGDITWDSYRLGRTVELSARPADNAGLEEFMMHEFFDPVGPAANR
jgi:hypothetical protein